MRRAQGSSHRARRRRRRRRPLRSCRSLASAISSATPRCRCPVTNENAAIVADIWVSYQQLAYAAAHGDSLNDKKAIDQAVAPLTKNMRLQQVHRLAREDVQGRLGQRSGVQPGRRRSLAARHILIAFPPAATQTQKDSVRKKAESVLAPVNNANFAADGQEVQQRSERQGQGRQPRRVREGRRWSRPFANGAAALKPGEIGRRSSSRRTASTSFSGFRSPRSTERSTRRSTRGSAVNKADSVYLAGLDKSANIEVKANAPPLAKSCRRTIRRSTARTTPTLATFKGGDLTVADFLGWVETMPPQMQVSRQLPQLPDSVVKPFVSPIAAAR